MSKFEVLICLLWQGINLLWQCISLYFKYIYILHKNWYNWSIYLSDWKLCSLDWRNFQKLQWKTRNWSYYWKQTIQTVLANEAIGTVLTQCGSTAQCGSCVDYMHILKHLYFSCLNFYWAETRDWFILYMKCSYHILLHLWWICIAVLNFPPDFRQNHKAWIRQ